MCHVTCATIISVPREVICSPAHIRPSNRPVVAPDSIREPVAFFILYSWLRKIPRPTREHGKLHHGGEHETNRKPATDRSGRGVVTERPVRATKPGNAGGAKGPQFRTNVEGGEGQQHRKRKDVARVLNDRGAF